MLTGPFFPWGWGCVSSPETGEHTLKCTALAAGVCSRRCFRIQFGALFVGAGLLFHSSVPFGRCNSCTIPLSTLFSFDHSFCYPHHLCLTTIPISHTVSTTGALTGRSLSKQETQIFSVLSSSFPLTSKSLLRTTTGQEHTALLRPSPHVRAANPAPQQPSQPLPTAGSAPDRCRHFLLVVCFFGRMGFGNMRSPGNLEAVPHPEPTGSSSGG